MEPTFKIMNAKTDPRSRFERRRQPRGGATGRAVVIGGQRVHIHYPISLTATHFLDFRVELERYSRRSKIQILGPEGGFVTFEQAIEICEAYFAPEVEEEPKIEVPVGAMQVEVTPGDDGEFGTEDDDVKVTRRPKPEPGPDEKGIDGSEADEIIIDDPAIPDGEEEGDSQGEETGSPAPAEEPEALDEEPGVEDTVEGYSDAILTESITALKRHLADSKDADYVEFLIEKEQEGKNRTGARTFLTELLDELEG